ncbi:MAG: hypothetical protein EPO26_12645 [Chloroflexota bacterium]|nr:MAG: hypothetical protein EPO26_12645 [Chloroflexota bacterium]
MLVGVLGDLHGRAFLGLLVALEWQRRNGRRFDLIVQVGDLGKPEPDPNDPHVRLDPAEADLGRLLGASGRRAENLRRASTLLPVPISFVRGNHDDPAWLESLASDGPADPFGIFEYVRDGTTRTVADLNVGFLGGVEEETGPAGLDLAALDRIATLGPGTVDLLVTHQGPYGTSTGFRGEIHGSPTISRLVEQLEPRWLVAGHAHTLHGPRAFGRTMYLGVDCIVCSPRWFPDVTTLQPGCLGVLDTASGSFLPVLDPWLSALDRRVDFDAYLESLSELS